MTRIPRELAFVLFSGIAIVGSSAVVHEDVITPDPTAPYNVAVFRSERQQMIMTPKPCA